MAEHRLLGFEDTTLISKVTSEAIFIIIGNGEFSSSGTVAFGPSQELEEEMLINLARIFILVQMKTDVEVNTHRQN